MMFTLKPVWCRLFNRPIILTFKSGSDIAGISPLAPGLLCGKQCARNTHEIRDPKAGRP